MSAGGGNDRPLTRAAHRLSSTEGVSLKFKYTRQHQTYSLPVMLYDLVAPDVVFYATAIPVRLNVPMRISA